MSADRSSRHVASLLPHCFTGSLGSREVCVIHGPIVLDPAPPFTIKMLPQNRKTERFPYGSRSHSVSKDGPCRVIPFIVAQTLRPQSRLGRECCPAFSTLNLGSAGQQLLCSEPGTGRAAVEDSHCFHSDVSFRLQPQQTEPPCS
jgi:hypothetical protein